MPLDPNSVVDSSDVDAGTNESYERFVFHEVKKKCFRASRSYFDCFEFSKPVESFFLFGGDTPLI